MNVSLRESTSTRKVMVVEVPASEVERGLTDIAREFQRRAALPGFRRGKVPLEMVRTHYAPAIEQDYLDDALPRLARLAVEREQLQPAVPPLIREVRFQAGQPLRFEVQVDVRPQAEARDYTRLRASVQRREVAEAQVDEVLRGLQEETAVYVDLERPAQRGDVVVLDSVRLDANGRRLPSTRARNLRIQLGSPGVLPDLENGLLASEAGQERTLTVSYPSDHGSPELAGKTVRYLVRIRKIQEKKLRPQDDNLARETFRLDSLDELRSRIRKTLEDQEDQRVRRELEGKISEALLERNPVDVPERMVDFALEAVIRDAVKGERVDESLIEELRRRYRPGVERSLKRELLLEAVARREGLSVSDEEVAEAIDREAAERPREASRVRARYHAPERREALRERLLERKTLEWLVKAADVSEETVGPGRRVVPASG